MKVAVFEPDPSFGGGSEQVILDLGRGLAQRGHSVFLIHSVAGTMMEQYRKFVVGSELTSLEPFGWRSFSSSLRRVLRIRRLLLQWKIDWLLCSCPHYVEFLSLVRRVSNTNICFHLGLPGTNSSFTMRAAQSKIDIGVAPSQHTADSWTSTGWIANRLHVIPNGIDTNRFRPRDDGGALRSKYGIRDDALVVTYVGRLAPEKGIATLLRAFARVSRKLSNSILVLAGNSTPGAPDWRQQAVDLSIPEHQIAFLGATNTPEEVYSMGDVVVVPSECQESFGLTVVEAMACKKAVVTSDVGIFRSIVGAIDPELVYPASDVNALTERLNYWLSDKLKRLSIGDESRKLAVASYSVDRMTDDYESVLRSQLNV